MEIRQTQAEQLGVKAYSRVSGGLEKVSLRLSANESFQDVEKDLAAMTGVSLGHSTNQRLVGRQSFDFAEAKQGVSEISIDGGKVRLRDLEESDSSWRDYKAVRVQGRDCTLFCVSGKLNQSYKETAYASPPHRDNQS